MTEAEKYQGHLYRGEKKKGKGQQQQQQHQQHESNSGVVAVVDVPPKAPSPPPTVDALPPGVNVFDFLVEDSSTKPAALPAANGASESLVGTGYSYGTGPVEPTSERYDSYTALPVPDDMVKTPATKREREEKKSDKKRKRENLELDTARTKNSHDHDMSDTPAFHTGLTGGLSRMLSGPNFSGDEAVTPLNPDKKRSKRERSDKTDEKKRSSATTTKTSSSRSQHEDAEERSRDSHRDDRRRKHRHHRDSSSSDDDNRASRKHVKAIDYRPASAEGRSDNQVVTYRSPAELFLSFCNKGPDSERGLSINKALKRYHREREIRGEREDDKELWKGLRVRKNERGEIVLFN